MSVALLSRGGVCPSVSRGGVPRPAVAVRCTFAPVPRPAVAACRWWRPVVLVFPFATKRAACPRCFVPPVARPCGASRFRRWCPLHWWRAACGARPSLCAACGALWRWCWCTFAACPVVLDVARVSFVASRGGASRAAGGLYKAKDKNGAPAVRWCVFGGCQRAPAVAGFVSRGGIEPPPAHQRGTKDTRTTSGGAVSAVLIA